MVLTHIPCGQDGWAHLAAVIDCHNRELIGYEFALRSRAQEAERAVEAAGLQRFGTLRPVGAPVLRSDNGLILPKPGGFGKPVGTIACSRSSSRRIRRSRMG